jgi:hypothetical protein
MKWQCLYCNDVWSTIPGSILRGSGCPICKSYKNEKIVANFLKDKNIFFEKKTICLNGSKIRPDFFIPQINLFIEYNGEQHYYPVKFGGMSDEKAIVQFKKQLVRDQNFRSYCLENTINLLEIDGRKFKSKDLFLFLEKYFSNIGNL